MFSRAAIEDRLSEAIRFAQSEVAHYTAQSTLVHLFSGGEGWTSLRATNIRLLNDRQEFALGCQELLEAARGANARSGIISALDAFNTGTTLPDIYSISFSGNPDELGQWRGYADNGMGVSLSTKVDALHSIADVSGPVIYDPIRRGRFARKIVRFLRDVKDPLVAAQYLQVASAFMKHEGFAPEQEYRLIVFGQQRKVIFRASGQRIVSSIDVLENQSPLPLLRVLIGPSWQLGSLPAQALPRHHVPLGLKQLLDARGLRSTRLAPSAIRTTRTDLIEVGRAVIQGQFDALFDLRRHHPIQRQRG